MNEPAPLYTGTDAVLIEPLDPARARLEDIEFLARRYAERRSRLAEVVQQLDDAIRQEKRRRLAEIKQRLGQAVAVREQLLACIEAQPKLFVKPKTRVLHGIRIGYRKSADKLDWDDDAQLVRRIEQLLPDQAELLIQRPPPKPIRKALGQLADGLLGKLGVRRLAGADEVVVQATDGEIDKLVDALLDVPVEEDPQR